MGPIRSKVGPVKTIQNGDTVFHENTPSENKFRSKGAELLWALPILSIKAQLCLCSECPHNLGSWFFK